MKKRLTQSEEFEIMKLVLDKFLWLGFALLGVALYALLTGAIDLLKGFLLFIAGAIILVLMMILLVKEYEIIK
ncbi:hypothetical protein C0585_04690 [Candidatus Woesearchaeota archaeon]|nr:MAG: hypothetical protein C0585_04690 [Candidatus Woesearchaeota archaeon]